MQLKQKISPNEELYGDFIPLPIPLEPVQQRIGFFRGKVEEYMHGDQEMFYKYHKAWIHWQGIKDEHCELDV